jgi:MoaA/NifB/PqqE/SkfB family radical SAM enzyme
MRSLPVLGTQAEVAEPPPFLSAATPVTYGPGFHDEELAEGFAFRWMALAGRIEFEPSPTRRFLELWVRSQFLDLSQRLVLSVDGQGPLDHELVRGWSPISVPVPAGARSARLAANKAFPRAFHPADPRDLAVQARGALLHADAARHDHIRRQHANAVVNARETLEGRTALSSTPPKLGIDIQGACNVKPPCVYCNWDLAKAREEDRVDLPFTRDTLREWGDFFENSSELVNCSIGEPFMGKNLDELLDAFGERGKVLEMATNGQILTEGNVRRLLGRNVHLYVSLDAATAETYARLRNARFTLVLDNVRRLVAAKGGPGHLPLVYLVFMPMRANAHEADAFVRLCAELKVDRMVLRPLNASEGNDLNWDRAGYRFEYRKELLPWAELVRISGRVAELCRRLGVDLSDQLDFGGSMEAEFAEAYGAGRREAARLVEPEPVAAETRTAPSAGGTPPPELAPPPSEPLPSLGEERLPVCTEPWSSLYILRRGVHPCCYGGGPIAAMADFAQAWNSPLMQAIRRALLRGTFHRYCFDSPDCPIVRKSHEARRLSPREEALREYRRLWDRAKRSRLGQGLKPYLRRLRSWLASRRP